MYFSLLKVYEIIKFCKKSHNEAQMMILRFFTLIILTFSFYSCGPILRILTGFKNPKVYSINEVEELIKNNNYNLSTYYLKVQKEKDSSEIFQKFLFGLSSDMYLYHAKTGEKYCYKSEEECSGIQMKKVFNEFENYYMPCISEDSENLNDLMLWLMDQHKQPVNTSSLPEAEYYLFQTWNNYIQSPKRFKEEFAWHNDLKNSNSRIKIIYVNTDLLEEWGLEKGKKLPVKFKRDGKKSVTMYFGKLPLKN